jgi:hypothetical protein
MNKKNSQNGHFHWIKCKNIRILRSKCRNLDSGGKNLLKSYLANQNAKLCSPVESASCLNFENSNNRLTLFLRNSKFSKSGIFFGKYVKLSLIGLILIFG